MKRLDAWLVELGLAPTRTKAQRLIQTGEVEVFARGLWQVAERSSASYEALDDTTVRIKPGAALLKYVSRGGLKLEAALKHVQIDVKGLRALDVGISTGVFTDCLLQPGCREVVGLDVGHGQLADAVANDPRVRHFEGVNVRELPSHPQVMAEIARGIDLCVVDVSFVSLQLIVPSLLSLLPPAVRCLALVKPQFELGAVALDKKGVVRDSSLQLQAVRQVLLRFQECGFTKVQDFACELKGQDGNQEYFIDAQRADLHPA
jgi:23S rRNA (cytidine1920-2'-O)/16S rRNA (cytidine1409-2'-O)-methyltransferase